MAETKINRDYIDNIGVKEFVNNGLIDEYFSDIDVSQRTVSMVGYTTEIVSNTTEDTFNTASVLYREAFPNRAELDESIYSHAALFQLSDVFSTPAECRFLMVMEESAIINNMNNYYDSERGYYYFFLDKNTTIYIEDMPYTLDYDVAFTIKKYNHDYSFTAKYIMDPNDYKNSISNITDPNIKVKRGNGYIAIEIITHQCTREVHYESIISNNFINYPVIDIPITGNLAGFDILYKSDDMDYELSLIEDESDPEKKDANLYIMDGYIQLDTLICYSQPERKPFCYYQMKDEDTLRITFNSRDNYFRPDFNSELKIIMYYTNGEDGNFDTYTGDNIFIEPDNSRYVYSYNYLVAAQPIGGATGGSFQLSLDSLQEITVANYRTATALTTDADLQEFFDTYKYIYNDIYIRFIKRRNDIYERVYSAFAVISDGDDYIYKTNTLKLKANLYDMENIDENVWSINPGTLFIVDEEEGYINFMCNQAVTDVEYNSYLSLIQQGLLPFKDGEDIPEYLKSRQKSYAQYLYEKKIDDKLTIFDVMNDETFFINNDNPFQGKFVFTNPFLIRFTKNPNLVTTYLTYVNNHSVLDFSAQNTDSYIQFTSYNLDLKRSFSEDKRFDLSLYISSNIALTDEHFPIYHEDVEVTNEDGYKSTERIYNLNNKLTLDKNDVRVIFMVSDDNLGNLFFTEMVPTKVESNGYILFEKSIFTDDHINGQGYLRLLDGEMWVDVNNGDYYIKNINNDLYSQYNKNNELVNSSVGNDVVYNKQQSGELVIFYDLVNMRPKDKFIYTPVTNVTCTIYILYDKIPSDTGLIKYKDEQTNNIFTGYNNSYYSYLGYVWTNQYLTATDPITFIKPLNNIRTFLTFQDYTLSTDDGFKYEVMDFVMNNINLLRAQTAKDEDKFNKFIDIFYTTYIFLEDIMKNNLRNETGIDMKFYNTYGQSENIFIGENEEELDTVNLKLEFDIWYLSGTDIYTATPQVKEFIKTEVEKMNTNGMNNLYISNLMRKIEMEFAFVNHIRFRSINNYDSTYQTVKNKVSDIEDLSVDERRFYVPEMLVIDLEDIIITEYFVQ